MVKANLKSQDYLA